MNVVIYARYSSHGQNEQSIEGQLKECREYAQRNNYTIIAEYIDRAKTGTKDSREQFLKMIEDSKQKKFTGVLVYQLDRFARNKYDSAIYKKQLKDRGIRVLSAKENITNDPAGMMLETVLEGMAEYYSLELSQKIIRGRKINNEHNYFNGGTVTFGYVTKEIDSPFCDAHGNPIKKKVIEIDDINGRIVTQTFLDVYNGMKFKDVIEKLKKQGVKTARGGYFDKSSLYRLLRNKKYITIRTYNGEDHLDFYPLLVSDEVFYGVQERLEKNKHKFDRLSKEEYLLVSKIFCGNCGNQYVGTSGTSKTKVVHKYYICVGKKNKSCNSKRIKKDFIEDIVINNARKVLTPDNINRIATTVVSLVEKEKNNSKIGQLNRALKQVEKKKSNIVNAIAECDNSNIRKTLYEELSKLEDQYSLLESDIANEENMSNVLSKTNIKHFLNQLKNGNVNDIKYKKSLIATLIKSVYVYEDKIVIFFNNTNEKMEITFDKVNEVKEFLCGNTCSTKLISKPFLRAFYFY